MTNITDELLKHILVERIFARIVLIVLDAANHFGEQAYDELPGGKRCQSLAIDILKLEEIVQVAGLAQPLGIGDGAENVQLHHVVEVTPRIAAMDEVHGIRFELVVVRAEKMRSAGRDLIVEFVQTSQQITARVVDDLHHLFANGIVVGEKVEGFERGAYDREIVQAIFQTGIGDAEQQIVRNICNRVGITNAAIGMYECIESIVGVQALDEHDTPIVAVRRGHGSFRLF